ncbi:MAG TPA: hypothetical protein VN724_18110 [Pyrinomonadaceae bacterium]|nr:hypothetical protein [Pyrinomonadaceae bacterium]
MANHSSATEREHTPHTINPDTYSSDAVKRLAWAVIQDQSIDEGSRNLIRYALEINDPLLAELVLRVDAGESIADDIKAEEASANDSTKPTIEALVEMICGAGDDAGTRSAALLVLMGMLQDAEDPKALANAAKHFAFTQCGEFNAFGMVDDQIASLGRELLINLSNLS